MDHPGRSCTQVHGGQTHAAWADEEELHEERQSTLRRYHNLVRETEELNRSYGHLLRR
jgi:hypothetical protein